LDKIDASLCGELEKKEILSKKARYKLLPCKLYMELADELGKMPDIAKRVEEGGIF